MEIVRKFIVRFLFADHISEYHSRFEFFRKGIKERKNRGKPGTEKYAKVLLTYAHTRRILHVSKTGLFHYVFSLPEKRNRKKSGCE